MDHYQNVAKNLKEICEECKNYGTNQCVPSNCRIGFAAAAIKLAQNNGEQVIENGVKLIPTGDMKFYEEYAIAKSIASICRLCKDCNENHSEECIVSLSRRSVESTYLKDAVVYPGNVLMYLMNISKESPDFANKIKKEFAQLS